jgi:hypothetical protein
LPELFDIPPIADLPQAAAGATDAPLISEPTHYEVIAEQITTAVNQAFAALASLEAPHSSTRDFVRGHQSIPNTFIRTVITTVQERPELQSLNKFNAAEGRDAMQFVDAIRGLVNRLEALAQVLRFTADARKAAVAASALQIYDIAKGIARDPGNGDLPLVVQQMARDLGRTRPKPRKKEGGAPATT